MPPAVPLAPLAEPGGAGAGACITFTALVEVGHLRLHLGNQPGQVADRLLQRAHILRHLVHARVQPDHRRDHLTLFVLQILLESVLNHRDGFAGVIGGVERLLHQHQDLRQLAVLRLLQLLHLVLQLRHIALQFLDLLAGGRQRRRDQPKAGCGQNAEHQNTSVHTNQSPGDRGLGIGSRKPAPDPIPLTTILLASRELGVAVLLPAGVVRALGLACSLP